MIDVKTIKIDSSFSIQMIVWYVDACQPKSEAYNSLAGDWSA